MEAMLGIAFLVLVFAIAAGTGRSKPAAKVKHCRKCGQKIKGGHQ